MKVGDVVEMLEDTGYWTEGDRVILERTWHNGWLVRGETGRWYASEADFKLVETAPKRGIRIKVQENNEGRYEILSFSALPKSELPREYLNSDGAVVYVAQFGKLIVRNEYSTMKFIEVGDIVTKKGFKKIITTCKQAGERLRKINQKPKESFEVII